MTLLEYLNFGLPWKPFKRIVNRKSWYKFQNFSIESNITYKSHNSMHKKHEHVM